MKNKYECTSVKKVPAKGGDAPMAEHFLYSFKPVGQCDYFTSSPGGSLSLRSFTPGLFAVGICYNLNFGGQEVEE